MVDKISFVGGNFDPAKNTFFWTPNTKLVKFASIQCFRISGSGKNVFVDTLWRRNRGGSFRWWKFQSTKNRSFYKQHGNEALMKYPSFKRCWISSPTTQGFVIAGVKRHPSIFKKVVYVRMHNSECGWIKYQSQQRHITNQLGHSHLLNEFAKIGSEFKLYCCCCYCWWWCIARLLLERVPFCLGRSNWPKCLSALKGNWNET